MYAAIDHCPDCTRTQVPGVYLTCSVCSSTGRCVVCGNTHVYVRDRAAQESRCVSCAVETLKKVPK